MQIAFQVVADGLLIRCGGYGGGIPAEITTNRHGGQYVYYHCFRMSKKPKCTQPYIRAEILEEQFLRFVQTIRLSSRLERWAVEAVTRRRRERHLDDVVQAAAERARRDSESQRKRLTDICLWGLISEEEYATASRRSKGISPGFSRSQKLWISHLEKVSLRNYKNSRSVSGF